MNRVVVAIIVLVLLILAIPVLVLLFFVPVRSGVEVGQGMDNRVPSDLSALTVHDRLAIELTWTSAGQGTATYVLQRSTTGGNGPWTDVAELEPGVSRYLDQGLEDGQTYFYRINAFDSAGGGGHSNVTSAVATDLPRPQ